MKRIKYFYIYTQELSGVHEIQLNERVRRR
jgi:hypothetical protein